MDMRNERLVFELLVETSCNENDAQVGIFNITWTKKLGILFYSQSYVLLVLVLFAYA